MIVETIPVGAFQCNCSILVCEESKEGIVVDPGGEAEKVLALVERLGVTLKYAVHTHAHVDHIGATKAVAARTGCEILLHNGDLYLYENLKMQLEWVGGLGIPAGELGIDDPETTPPHRFVGDGEEIAFGKEKVVVMHTPGHTPGSICFQHEGPGTGGGDGAGGGTAGPARVEGRLFTGDTLFAQGIGRTDLWGGDYGQIIDSIKGRILRLDDDIAVISGHGPSTTIGRERRGNPFLQ